MSVVNDANLSDRVKDVDPTFLRPAPSRGGGATTLGRSATSHGNLVWSLRPDDDDDKEKRGPNHHNNSSSSSASKWTVPFQDPVHLIAESADGALVAVVTIGGTVALLDGANGRVLITRTLPPPFSSSSSALGGAGSDASSSATSSIVVAWTRRDVAHDANHHNGTTAAPHSHSLLIAMNGGAVTVGEDDDDDGFDCQLMLVRSVETLLPLLGAAPGGPSADRPSSPQLSTAKVKGYRFSSLTGRDTGVGSSSEIHVLGCSIDDASLADLRWDVARNAVRVRPLGVASRPHCHVDAQAGLLRMTVQDHGFVMCSTFVETTKRSVEWLVESSSASSSLESACRYELPFPKSRVSAMETLQCDSSSLNSLAVAVAVSSTSSSPAGAATSILVLQLLAEETMGLVVLSQPHALYNIPLEPVCAHVELAASVSYPFWFLFKEWRRPSDKPTPWSACYKRFSPPPTTSRVLARVKGLVEKGRLDEASRLLGEAGSRERAALVEDEYSTFVPCDIPLRQLKGVFVQAERSGGLRGSDVPLIENFAQELVDATSTNANRFESGRAHLLETADLLTSLMGSPTPAQARTHLSVADQLLGNVDTRSGDSGFVPRDAWDAGKDLTEARRKGIRDQVEVLDYLSQLVEKSGVDPEAVRLDDTFRSIRTLAQLFEALVEQRFFALAERMWHQAAGSDTQVLSPHVLVSAVLRISPEVPPQAYSALLEDVVLPQLTITHQYLRTLRSWACRVADRLDASSPNEAGLGSAIHLLEVTDRGTRALQLRLFSSFASDSPLVEMSESRLPGESVRRATSTGKRTILNAIPSNSSSRTDNSHSSAPFVMKHEDGSLSAPTLLSVSALRKGVASRGTNLTYHAPGDDDYDSNVNCVQEKLHDARCLLDARRAGLDRTIVTLKTMSSVGGAPFIAGKLLELSNGPSYEAFLKGTVGPFCHAYSVDFDASILRHVESKSKVTGHQSLTNCAKACRCCQSDVMKSKAALCVLRAISRCGVFPGWVTTLSQQALAWASSDSGLQSEVEEVTRLLRIDRIIVRYCGAEARRMFRIDNPHHSKRLLKHVAKQYGNKSVLVDSFALCDAFSHLSRLEALSLILDQAVMHAHPELCAEMVRAVYPQDRSLAEHALSNVMSSVETILWESSLPSKTIKSLDARHVNARSAVVCLLSVLAAMLEYTTEVSTSTFSRPNKILRTFSLETMKRKYEQVQRLQALGIFASLCQLSKPEFIFKCASKMLHDVVSTVTSDQSMFTTTKIAIAKKACSLLILDPSRTEFDHVWVNACCSAAVTLVEQRRDAQLPDFMRLVGLFDQHESSKAAFALLPIAKSLFLRAYQDADKVESYDSMVRVVNVSHLMQDRSLLGSSGRVLLSVVNLGSVAGTACDMLRRCDEGIGEALDERLHSLQLHSCDEAHNTAKPIQRTTHRDQIPVRRPALCANWCIGDGLLLHPRQTIKHALDFCAGALFGSKSDVPALDFLRHHGAHFLTLRVLSAIVSAFAGSSEERMKRRQQTRRRDLGIAYADAVASLAERCLGGSSQVGLTNGTIDPQLGTTFLLSLPVKQAFSIYKDSLPSSFKSRNYGRSLMLSLVGLVASSDANGEPTEGYMRVGWKQTKFKNQCKKIAIQSRWLDRLQSKGIPFDAHGFDSGEQDYAASLMPLIVEKLSTILDPPAVLDWYSEFSRTFGVPRDVCVRAHISWCLAPRKNRGGMDHCKDLRNIENFVRRLLNRISPRQRCDVLRHCIVDLEESAAVGTNYEQFSLVLALYHEELLSFASMDTASTVARSAFQDLGSEIDVIDRRRDVLSILMSYFKGDRAKQRPCFPAFFSPLRANGMPTTGFMGSSVSCVLGTDSGFDPLNALEGLFAEEVDTSILTALAPISVSLGLPQGYIHVRFLMARFLRGGIQPSFENDVLPTLRKLRKASDRVAVAEWCARKYENSDDDKLKCVEMALESAVQASTELEARKVRDAAREELFLDTVKRLSCEKSALTDILRTKAILRQGLQESGQSIQVVDELITSLGKFVLECSLPQPEQLIDFLLSHGSLLVAESSLDQTFPLSESQLKKLCCLIQMACKSLVDQHTHIQFHRRCKRLANQWLYHGDGELELHSETGSSDSDFIQPRWTELRSLNEDETTSFEMNLDVFQEDEGGLGGQRPPSRVPTRNTSDEEHSSLLPESDREVSETASHRASIRIAFVLALPNDLDGANDSTEGENTASGIIRVSATPSLQSSLVSKIGSIGSIHFSRQEQCALDHSRDLLGIVFAKQLSSAGLGSHSSNDQLDDSYAEASPKILTFAMRHRAFRAASILCPQEALERVAEEERLLYDGSSRLCTLKACTFGMFVAKEIEELGLALPHSDLCRLSSMHFPSYARALKRDFRDAVRKGDQGRFMLLMLEMSLRGELSVDKAFVESLLDEMVQRRLPRTILMAAERLCGDATRRRRAQAILRGSIFEKALLSFSSSMASELRQVSETNVMEKHVATAAKETLSRLGAVAIALRSVESDWLALSRHALTTLEPLITDVELQECLRKVLRQLGHCAPPPSTELTVTQPPNSMADASLTVSIALHRVEGSTTIPPVSHT